MQVPKLRSALLALALFCAVAPARAADFQLARGQAAVGAVGSYAIQAGDTLLDLARRVVCVRCAWPKTTACVGWRSRDPMPRC